MVDDLGGQATRDLLAYHFKQMHAASPPDTAFVLDLSGLKRPDITVWTLREGEAVLGIAALKTLDDGTGEVKSMRTHPDHLRKGVARALLVHLIDEARRCGMTRLSLETGTGETFEPALAMYRAHGFVSGAAFAGYDCVADSGFNQFLHLDLA